MRDGAYWRRLIGRREASMEVKSFREMSHIGGKGSNGITIGDDIKALQLKG